MKKNLLILLCFITSNCFGQTAYYDALFCASLRPEDCAELNGLTGADEKVMDELKGFLERPFDTLKPLPDFARARLILRRQQAMDDFGSKSSGATGIQAANLLLSFFNVSSLSPAQSDSLLNGITIYFEKGFRREYAQTYIRLFDRSIGKVGELQVLFPATHAKMRTFDPARYKSLGNELKAVFDDDMAHSLTYLMNHIDNPDTDKKYQLLTPAWCARVSQLNEYKYIKLSASIGQKLIDGVHPGNIIATLANNYEDGYPKDLKDKFFVLNLLQQALRDTAASTSGGKNVWIDVEKLGKLDTPLKRAYFTALLYHADRTKFTSFFDPKLIIPDKPRDTLTTKFAAYNTIGPKVTGILSLLGQMDNYSHLKGQDLFTEQNFLPFMEMMVDVVKLIDKRENAQLSTTILKNGFLLYNAIRVKNYQNMPHYVAETLKPALVKYSKKNISPLLKAKVFSDSTKFNKQTFLEKIRQNKDSTLNEFIDGNSILNDLFPKDTIKKNSKEILNYFSKISYQADSIALGMLDLFQKIDKVTAFTSGVVSATSSEGISDVISQFAAPSSTAVDKRGTPFSITVTGMPGLYVGMERFVPEQVPTSFTATNNYRFNGGITLPIGVDFTFALRDLWGKKKKSLDNNPPNPFSLGVFASVIDLGAMLNYRLANNSNTLPEHVPWQSILSPGVSVVLGFPNSPLTLGLGYQYGPKLRKFKQENATPSAQPQETPDELNTHLFQLRLAYDIPLFRVVGRR
ncbi:hypothetical protein [Spirosoma sp. KUDC1026]|uniref:hypothetical protein n=1 Tax=Spirosoma sp. KUDC1026 TaxID=2745947 RepID=UPI00159BE930|nr:hypothetical protein [Spirosoma sp. KUDC1026]QKZ14130.1 hypothetical protein HU175_16445 [Spirosoma sp. KUDC1026]